MTNFIVNRNVVLEILDTGAPQYQDKKKHVSERNVVYRSPSPLPLHPLTLSLLSFSLPLTVVSME